MKKLEFKILSLENSHYFTTFIHPLTKKRMRKTFLTKKEAEEYKKEVEYRFRYDRIKNYLDLTVTELLCLFVKDYPDSPFSRKKGGYLSDFIDTFGDFLLAELTSSVLKSWLNQIQFENKLKDITIRGVKCEIDSFFSYLVRKEIISESPLKRIYYKKSSPRLKSRNILSRKEMEEVLFQIKSYSPGYLYPIIKLFVETGAKTSEVIGLTWDDIDLKKKEIVFKSEKKNQMRKLPLSDELINLLSQKDKKTPKVFMTYYKEIFTLKKLHLAIREFKLKTSCKILWSPSDLRHSFAVEFLSSGGDIKELQKILGHDNVFDTKRLYGEVVTKKIIESTASPF